jgi:hypothetical protein
MDATPQKPSRNSRWSRAPVKGEDGAPVAVSPTERDFEVFALLARFRYLPADYIHAFVGGNAKALCHRLSLLSRKPNLYLSRPLQQRLRADANHRPLIYELEERAIRLLRERGRAMPPKTYHRNFAHQVMIAQITASIELGARASPTARLIDWQEIIANEKTPAALRSGPMPTAVTVSYSFRGQNRTEQIIADGKPFGIERTVDGARSYLFFPGIEADCATEPIDTRDAERSSIARKLSAYLAVVEQGLHRSHFGFPNFFVPFITTTTARMRSIIGLLEHMTGGQGSKIFLFKTFPAFCSPDPSGAPSGRMLTEEWQRAGFPPLTLDL